MVNAVIGKKNKTWCDHLMLDATQSSAASRLFASLHVHVAATGLSA